MFHHNASRQIPKLDREALYEMERTGTPPRGITTPATRAFIKPSPVAFAPAKELRM